MWVMPVMLPTWEAEIRGTAVPDQWGSVGGRVCGGTHLNRKNAWCIVHHCHPNKGKKFKIGGSWS
jgi:hypothetical protein